MENDEMIPESLRPMLEWAERSMVDRNIEEQRRGEYESAWKDKSISIPEAEEFLDAHKKTGMFLVYWDQDESSAVTLQSLVCGKTNADRVMANIMRRILGNVLGGGI